MIRETYKGRQLKAIKGKSFGKSRISVNGTECGEWLGTQADVIEWAKRTIDAHGLVVAPGFVEHHGQGQPYEGGHVVAPGGICSCDYCEKRRNEPCANITAGGVCVCDHCMKPYLADSTEEAAPEVIWTDKTDRRMRPYADADRWEVVANGKTYLGERTKHFAHHVWHDGEWLGMYATREEVEAAITALAPTEGPTGPEAQEATDADVVRAFEVKDDEVAKANGWTISHTETVMLRYLRDTSPAEAATIAAALTQRTRQAA